MMTSKQLNDISRGHVIYVGRNYCDKVRQFLSQSNLPVDNFFGVEMVYADSESCVTCGEVPVDRCMGCNIPHCESHCVGGEDVSGDAEV